VYKYLLALKAKSKGSMDRQNFRKGVENIVKVELDNGINEIEVCLCPLGLNPIGTKT